MMPLTPGSVYFSFVSRANAVSQGTCQKMKQDLISDLSSRFYFDDSINIDECKPDELLSVKPAITGAVSGIVKREGTIAIRLSSDERFLFGVEFTLSEYSNSISIVYKKL